MKELKQCSIEGCSGKHKGYGYCIKHYTAFKRFGDPLGGKTYNKRGSGSISTTGYKRHSQKHEHIMVAENIFGGPLPKGYVVHHIDGNQLNNDPGNLAICVSQAEHMKLHLSEKALKECGNAEYRMCTYCKVWSDPGDMRPIKKGALYVHHECMKKLNQKYTSDKRRKK